MTSLPSRHRIAVLASMGSAIAVALAMTAPVLPATAAAAPEVCVVPGDQDLRAASRPEPSGLYRHQAWLARTEVQRGAEALETAVEDVSGARADSEGRLAAGYLGTAVDHHSQQLVVVVDPMLVDPAQVQTKLAAAATRASASALKVTVRAGCFSAAQLAEADAVIGARAWHPNAARVTFGGYLDPADSRYHMTFWQHDEAVASALQARLGDRVRIDYGTPALRSRAADTAPHWGGAGIRSSTQSGNTCTSGFTVRLPSGSRAMVTAGHCFNNGQAIYSGPYYFGGAGGEWNYPADDMIVTTSGVTTYGHYLYSDPYGTTHAVTGAATAAPHTYVCKSGMVTKAVCYIEVLGTGGRLCYDGGCNTYMLVATRPGVLVGQHGDSGGPVFARPTTTTATIRGMEVGGTAFDNLYGENWSQIAAHFNATIVTS
jgi:hypothetical protein